MTRKDFELIADTIKIARELSKKPGAHTDTHTVDGVAKLFSIVLQETNNAFNPDRFLKACEVEW